MIQIAELINHFVNGIVNMGTVKKVKKAEAGAVCGPGFGKRKGSCTPSGRSMGAFGRSNRTMKTEGYKPGRPIKFKEEGSPDKTSGSSDKPYERDFPGDKAPGGFNQSATGKKGTRWTTDKKGKIKYAGQSFKNGGKKVVKKAKMGKKVSKQSKKK